MAVRRWLLQLLPLLLAAGGPQPVHVDKGVFRDSTGRQVLLHGVNLVNKSAATGFRPGNAGDFAEMAARGFNCVRLGILWAGLEPQPGQVDEAYLEAIDQRIAWAQRHGIRVMLDMHQDLYSVRFGNGAPAWATLDGGHPFKEGGGVWSDAYFNSPAVQAAFDHFWRNAPGPDGVGLQDHLARVWQAVARRYANHPAVLGFDLINEPFPGQAATEAQAAFLGKAAERIAAHPQAPKGGSPEALEALWQDPAGRERLLGLLDEPEAFASVVDAAKPVFQTFDRTQLMPFYQRVAKAIRAVAPKKILFLGTTMASNSGVPSAIEPVQGEGGQRDPQQAYAPHAYDLVTDTQASTRPSAGRLGFIFQRHEETARRLAMPVLVGEWGAYYLAAIPASTAWMVTEHIERRGWGDTYWSMEDLDRATYATAIHRPYAAAVPGELLEARTEPGPRRFLCRWREDARVKAPARIFLPDWMEPRRRRIQVVPAGPVTLERRPRGVWLVVPPTGKGGERKVQVGE